MSSPVLLTPPAALPVSLAEAKQYTNIDLDHDDDLVEDLIRGAVSRLDGWTGLLGRAIEAQTWELTQPRFPAAELRLPLGPVVSVTSILFVEAGGSAQTLDPGDYTLSNDVVQPVATWPATKSGPGAVRVRWVAGTGCPAGLKDVIRRMVRHEYDHREAMDEKAIVAQIAPWRRVSL